MPKLGNTDFIDGYAKGMPFNEFRDRFAGILDGIDIKEAFKRLGGTMSIKTPATENKTDKKLSK